MTKKTKNNIALLKEQLPNVQTLPREELLPVLKVILKEAGGQFLEDREDFFKRIDVQETLISLGQKYIEDDKIIADLILSLGFASRMYDFWSDAVFDFFVQNMDKKDNKTRMAIARFIAHFPQFETYDKCWKYLLEIPKISPKKDSRVYFIIAVKNRVDKIPIKYRTEVVQIINGYLEQYKLDVDSKKMYKDIIRQLNKYSQD